MDLLNFNLSLKSLKSIDFIPFFVEYLNKHQYINSHNLSRDYLKEKVELSHYNPNFNRIIRTLTSKFRFLIRVGIKLGFLERFNSTSFNVLNRERLNLKIISDSVKKVINSKDIKTKNMESSHFNSYLKNLKSIELIPFFIEYLEKNHYINSHNLSRDYLRENVELSHYNPNFNRFARILTFKFKVLVQVGIKLGFLEIYNSSVLEVSNRKGLNLKIILDGLKKARISNNCSNNSNSDLNFRLNNLDKEKLDGIAKKERKSRSFILRCLVNNFLNKMDQDNQNKRLKLIIADSSEQTKILNFNINFGIKKEIKEKLDKIAKENEINISLILRGLIYKFINQYKTDRNQVLSNKININIPNKSLYS